MQPAFLGVDLAAGIVMASRRGCLVTCSSYPPTLESYSGDCAPIPCFLFGVIMFIAFRSSLVALAVAYRGSGRGEAPSRIIFSPLLEERGIKGVR